ncbi:mannose-1-phosphate guanylyltransferase/mannose-6-phosphate isomerase [Dyella terrae]|uniref:Xanthan biosynthesis protein XanB n=3 Tax=Rhodanobacteraceae TaxID=1775411 RepID=A0A4R0Z2G9_9GAMM|nr:mannose-1-phosphate guanylyltransferase/mannose-6-phosphate isomerase [Dyella terrae]TCI13844.1 mannose-1-phosphate guanylyltransferase/mannose-6-phosphate isomerase [Dyella soli]
MAGGTGTRLWPLSREQYPKQFLTLIGPLSLFQQTAQRATGIDNAVAPVVLGSEDHRFVIAEQLQDIEIKPSAILLEPQSRNTLAAAAVAAQHIAVRHGEDAFAFLMAADHYIADFVAFQLATYAAAQAATRDCIVTFGITPTRPETGYGYIRSGETIDQNDVRAVEQFVEKPNAETARTFLASGDYFWNGGMFLFRCGHFLEELRRLEPETYERSLHAVQYARQDNGFTHLDAEAFSLCRNDSIDYAVMEKTQRIALVPLDAGWEDVGSWSYLDHMPSDDPSQNHTEGDVLLEDATGNLVHASSRLVALIGVDDHIVVETDDAVLVAPKDRAQDIKRVVQSLKRDKRSEVENHRRVFRPWGFYETIAGGDRFQVKRICVKPGQKLSLQMHYHRAEHWVIVRGTARVTIAEKTFILTEDQSTYIRLGNTHRLENAGRIPLELIEVQTGVYLGEDDIVRFSDAYGRTEGTTELQATPVPTPA